MELDPLAETGNVWLGEVLTHLGRFPDAIDHLRTVVELAPTSWFAHQILAMAYSLDARHSEAFAEAQTAITLTGRHPWSLAILAVTYAASGETAPASAIYDELVARSRVEYVSPYVLAMLSGALGKKDEAFEWLDRAYDERDPILHSVARHAYLAPLRDDPRFDALLKRMGLE